MEIGIVALLIRIYLVLLLRFYDDLLLQNRINEQISYFIRPILTTTTPLTTTIDIEPPLFSAYTHDRISIWCGSNISIDRSHFHGLLGLAFFLFMQLSALWVTWALTDISKWFNNFLLLFKESCCFFIIESTHNNEPNGCGVFGKPKREKQDVRMRRYR